MTTITKRGRRRSLGVLAAAATIAFVGASTASATTVPPGTESSGTAAGASAAGGDAATVIANLYAAAKEEGKVNLIALPPTWANYQGILASFAEKYPGIDTPVQNPEGSSADELTAVDTQRGTDTMPDSIDVGPSFALQAVDEGIWDPYKPTTWDEIPDNLKDPDGNWVGAYYGIMAVGVNTTLVDNVPTSFADLNDPQYAGQVALNGDPREAGAAFAAVMAASLANGGSLDDIMPGIQYFADLKAAGILSDTQVTPATVSSGETPIVLDWTYNMPGIVDGGGGRRLHVDVVRAERRRVRLVLRPGRGGRQPGPQRRPPVDRAHPVRRGCPRLPPGRCHPGSLRGARRQRDDHP